MFSFLFICMILADLLFPPDEMGLPGYIPFTRTISGQGNHGDNPIGAWFFVAGLVGTSVCLVPFAIYSWRQLAVVCKNTASVAMFFSIASAVGFSMVGIWDEQSTCLLFDGGGACILRSNDVHDVGSALAFGGSLLAVLINLFPMLSRRVKTRKDEFGAWWQIAHIVSFIMIFVLETVASELGNVPAFFARYAFWQWSLFVALVVYYASLAIRLPAPLPAAHTG